MPSQAHIPTYIPLDQAARHYGLSKKVLTQEIQAGKIQAVQLPSGDLLVAAENNGRDYQTKEEIIAQKFAHLRRKSITPYAAQKRYNIHRVVVISRLMICHFSLRKTRSSVMTLPLPNFAIAQEVFLAL